MLRYRGYTARVSHDAEAGLYHGVVENVADTIHFEGRTLDEARHAFRDSVDDYLEWAAQTPFEPEKPYSGSIMVQVAPELHKRAASAARRSRMSLNDFIGSCLRSAVGGRPLTERSRRKRAGQSSLQK